MRGVFVDGHIVDVRIAEGTVLKLGTSLPPDGTDEIDGRGGALIPGLHDHHVHLLAAAAAAVSVPCGPDSVQSPGALAAALRVAPGTDWVRGVGYDELVAGELDRSRLDMLVPDRPARVQHRSGSLWVINSAGLDLLGVGAPADGRLWRRDEWLRERLGAEAVPSLAALGARLAAFGVTGVTDATPGSAEGLASAVRGLPQRVVSLADTSGTELTPGPRKIVLGDHALPTYDELVAMVCVARDQGRAIAVHSVTRASLFLLLAVLDQVGVVAGDRVEHAAVAPREAVDALALLQVAVVTQPSFVARRGDDYLDEVEADDVPHLWRYGSFCAAGVAVACSSDAPYGDLDPWSSVRAARDRVTPSGRIVGARERVSASVALGGFLADPLSPGFAPRRVAIGAPADLVLLDAPLDAMLTRPDAARVRLTTIKGEVVYDRTTDG